MFSTFEIWLPSQPLARSLAPFCSQSRSPTQIRRFALQPRENNGLIFQPHKPFLSCKTHHRVELKTDKWRLLQRTTQKSVLSLIRLRNSIPFTDPFLRRTCTPPLQANRLRLDCPNRYLLDSPRSHHCSTSLSVMLDNVPRYSLVSLDRACEIACRALPSLEK